MTLRKRRFGQTTRFCLPIFVTATLRKYEEMEKTLLCLKNKSWPIPETGTSNCSGNAYDVAESSDYRYTTTLGYIDRIFVSVLVIGMIRSFAALSAGGGAGLYGFVIRYFGSPWSIRLSVSWQVRWLLFLTTTSLTKLTNWTYGLDEVGFSIVQTLQLLLIWRTL